MLTKYDDIFTRYERGTIGEEEFQDQLRNELPNPAPTMNNFLLPDTSKTVSFGFANHPYMYTMKSERYSTITAERIRQKQSTYRRNSSLSRKPLT